MRLHAHDAGRGGRGKKLIRGGDGEAAAAYACLFSFSLTPSQYFALDRRERAFLLAALQVRAERGE